MLYLLTDDGAVASSTALRSPPHAWHEVGLNNMNGGGKKKTVKGTLCCLFDTMGCR